MKNIYVGNLSFDTTEDELRSLFANYGKVSAVSLPQDRYSGQKRGFGFVEMASDAEGQKAITELSGSKIRGRTLVVNEARQRPAERRAG